MSLSFVVTRIEWKIAPIKRKLVYMEVSCRLLVRKVSRDSENDEEVRVFFQSAFLFFFETYCLPYFFFLDVLRLRYVLGCVLRVIHSFVLSSVLIPCWILSFNLSRLKIHCFLLLCV